MVSDAKLALLVGALHASKHAQRAASHAGAPPSDPGIPAEVLRFVTALAGWSYGDLRFTSAETLEQDRAFLSGLAAEFEAGGERWSHAFWHRAWYPLALSGTEVLAYDPIGCFGGPTGQVVVYDFKGGESWCIFPTLGAWIDAFTTGLESGEAAEWFALDWGARHAGMTREPLPTDPLARRSPARFDAGLGAWIRMRHPDGRRWAIRARRDGYDLEVGEPDEMVARRRVCASPGEQVRRLVEEQAREGFEPA